MAVLRGASKLGLSEFGQDVPSKCRKIAVSERLLHDLEAATRIRHL